MEDIEIYGRYWFIDIESKWIIYRREKPFQEN